MWCPQFLWRGEKLAAIVDWQCCHPGSFMEDLLHILTTCVRAVDRMRLTPTLLRYYHKELNARLAEQGSSISITFETVLEEYKAALPYNAGRTLFAFAMWSKSPVLKDGSENEQERIAEIQNRVISMVEETNDVLGWK